jgi:hypothetical protein
MEGEATNNSLRAIARGELTILGTVALTDWRLVLLYLDRLAPFVGTTREERPYGKSSGSSWIVITGKTEPRERSETKNRCLKNSTQKRINRGEPVGSSERIVLRRKLLACRAISEQRLGKHVPGATDMHAKTEILLETVFSTRSAQKGYKEDNLSKHSSVGRQPPFRKDLSPEAEN